MQCRSRLVARGQGPGHRGQDQGQMEIPGVVLVLRQLKSSVLSLTLAASLSASRARRDAQGRRAENICQAQT